MEIECLAAAATAQELRTLLGKQQIDLVLVSGDGGRNLSPGLHEAMSLKNEMPQIRVIAIMTSIDNARLQASLEFGVDGLLVRPFLEIECLNVLRGVIAGGFGMQRGALLRLVSGSADLDATPLGTKPIALKPAEANIIDLLAQGLRYKEVADRLDISKAKMKRLTTRAYEKLDATSRIEAINHWRRASAWWKNNSDQQQKRKWPQKGAKGA